MTFERGGSRVCNHGTAEYAQKTLYTFMLCEGLRGTDYVDEVCRRFYRNSWADFLRDFVEDMANVWCPTWIKRNYEILNQVDLTTSTSDVRIIF